MKLLTMKQVVKRLGIPRSKAYQLVEDGKIPCLERKERERIWITPEALEQYIEAQRPFSPSPCLPGRSHTFQVEGQDLIINFWKDVIQVIHESDNPATEQWSFPPAALLELLKAANRIQAALNAQHLGEFFRRGRTDSLLAVSVFRKHADSYTGPDSRFAVEVYNDHGGALEEFQTAREAMERACLIFMDEL